MALPIPESLNAPRTGNVSQRRALSGLITNTSAPTLVTEGFPTRNHQYLHMLAQARDSGSYDVTLWGWLDVAGVWAIMTWIGTVGVVSVSFAGGAVMIEPALIAGIDRVFPQITNYAASAEADVWLAGSSFD